jgi:hypothetical protein
MENPQYHLLFSRRDATRHSRITGNYRSCKPQFLIRLFCRKVNDTQKPMSPHEHQWIPIPADDRGRVIESCLIYDTLGSNDRHNGQHGG